MEEEVPPHTHPQLKHGSLNDCFNAGSLACVRARSLMRARACDDKSGHYQPSHLEDQRWQYSMWHWESAGCTHLVQVRALTLEVSAGTHS